MSLASPPFTAKQLDLPCTTDAPVCGAWLDAELDFYRGYLGWLNPCPTVGQAVVRLGSELDRVTRVRIGWQFNEVLTNLFLLTCTLLNSADDYLRGSDYRLPRRAALLPFSRVGLWGVRKLTALRRMRRVGKVRRWRESCQASLDVFLPFLMAGEAAERETFACRVGTLRALLAESLPSDLLGQISQIPSPFRKQDLTPFDVLDLGRKWMVQFPERRQPVLVMGLRTAGSYFAPLLGAFLRSEGYDTVDSLTVRPNKGPSTGEQTELVRCAAAGYRTILVDDPPGSGDTFVQAISLLRSAGFAADKIAVLYPTHPHRRDWKSQPQSIVLADLPVLTLEPEEWHKQRLLEPKQVEGRLTEYYRQRGYCGVRVVASAAADQLTANLEAAAEETRRIRLKRVYEVCLETSDGQRETRYVLAKSVGWGWLSYHAFLAGQHLAGFVPPMLGLRDGILYTEWLPQSAEGASAREDRDARIQTTARYVAARTRFLGVGKVSADFGRNSQHEGFALLSKVLSKAYGGVAIAGLMRPPRPA